jgi:hypothetical protein
MTSDWFYKVLDLPPVPEQLETAALALLPDLTDEIKSYGHLADVRKAQGFNSKSNHMSITRKIIKDGKQISHAPNLAADLDQDAVRWAKANIAEDFLHIQLSWTPKNRRESGAHSDATRNYTLIYLLDPGGDNVITTFYKEKDQPLHRPNKTFVDYYSLLDKVASVRIKPRTWTVLNSTILHGVENIERPRYAIQIGLDKFN